MKKIFVTILTLIFSLSFMKTMPVAALQAGDIVLSVRPSEQSIALHPGENLDGVVQVSNNGRLDFTFELSSTAFRITNNHYDAEFSNETATTGLPSWISFDQPSYHIGVGEKIEVPFHISVPEDVPSGSQYAAIIVRTKDSADSEATVRVITQVAALVYGHVIGGETREEGAVVEQSMTTLLLSKDFSATAVVENTGNIDFRFLHELTIYDFFTGREVVTPDAVDENDNPIAAAALTVLPGTSRTSTLKWDNAPMLGLFRIRQTVSFLEESFTVEKVVFFCPIWLVIAVAAFIVLIILWIIIRAASRKNRQPQVF